MRFTKEQTHFLTGCIAFSLLCFSGGAQALTCPSPPVQVASDTKLQVQGEIGTWKKLIGAGGTVQLEKKAQELYSNYPNADRLVLSSLMISIFCEQLKESDELDEAKKFDLIFKFNERIMKVSSPSGENEKYLEKKQVSLLQQAFSDDDPNSVRIALGKALDSKNEFMQNLALKAMFGGKKTLFSGVLTYHKRQTSFMLEIDSFSELDGSLTGKFLGWKEEFRGQLTGTTLVIIGGRYSLAPH